MTTVTQDPAASGPSLESRGIRLGDVLFRGVAVVAAAAATVLLGLIAYKVIEQAWPAIEHFGLSFVWTEAWNPVQDEYGALTFIYGTVVTSVIALLLATPISIAIALFLTEIAPRRIAAPIATLVELLAAIPSVVLGLWGILVFGPWVAENLEPWLEKWLGFIPLFEGTFYQAGMLPAALVLTIMIVPITSAICRELFSRTPRDLTDGALALGSTRWEAIRGVMFAYAAPGIAAAVLLGLGRAFGEAIAVAQVIGGSDHINVSLFAPADTLGARIASQYQGATTPLQQGSLLYLGAILMVISLVTNVCAQLIVRRFEKQRRAV
jgi:phosphate transport system permease protein